MVLKRTLVLAILFFCIVSRADETSARVLSLPEYVSQLDQLIAETDRLKDSPKDIDELTGMIPPEGYWVEDNGQKFHVTTQLLWGSLNDDKKTDAIRLSDLRRVLLMMRSDADAYGKVPADSSRERATLSTILARREFKSVHGPTWMDRFKQKLMALIVGALVRLFGSSLAPTIGKVIVWGVVALAVFVVAYVVYRMIRSRAELETIMPEPLPVSAREWSLWMADARNAAGEGRWREAIHFAYWAGISLLESQGLWRPDRARTPREYLRLLPPSSQFGPALNALTRRFEVVWYGYETADENSYAQTVAELEKLGCR